MPATREHVKRFGMRQDSQLTTITPRNIVTTDIS